MLKGTYHNAYDRIIVGVILLMLVAILTLLALNLYAQYDNYQDAMRKTFEFAEDAAMSLNHSAVLAYSRAWDFAVAKTSTLFLAFLTIFTGGLYVLRVGETKFELMGESIGFRGILSISSPGLAMMALGVIIVGLVLLTKSSVEYSQPQSFYIQSEENEISQGSPTE